MGFSNIAKNKYSWALNRIGCAHWVQMVSFGCSLGLEGQFSNKVGCAYDPV